MNRGELWTATGGVYASKRRPVLIIQDDRFAGTDSVVVIPLTTQQVDAPLTRIPIAANDLSGIEHDSFAMVDKITTIRRTHQRRDHDHSRERRSLRRPNLDGLRPYSSHAMAL